MNVVLTWWPLLRLTFIFNVSQLSSRRPRSMRLGVQDIDPKLYDLTVVSLRNHMVFTPLLASACVGTLEARAVAQPITRLQVWLTATWRPHSLHVS